MITSKFFNMGQVVTTRSINDFMERITEIFLYQMDKKEDKRLLWKFVHKI